jgi:hypothetical protein
MFAQSRSTGAKMMLAKPRLSSAVRRDQPPKSVKNAYFEQISSDLREELPKRPKSYA